MEQMEKDGKTLLAPDSITYGHVLTCWLRSGSPDTATNAKIIFDKVVEKYSSGRSSLFLNASIFETILHCLSHKKYGDRKLAKSVINEMILLSKENKNWMPTSTCLNLAIRAEGSQLNGQPQRRAAFDAQKLLLQFVEKYKNGEIDVLPDAIGFNTVISKWAQTEQHGVVKQVEKLFRVMEELSKQKGLQYISPDKYTFSNIFKVFGRYRQSDKAFEVLNKIEKGEAKLDTSVYNSILVVCTRSRDPMKGIKAAKLLDRMISLNMTNSSSYNLVLRACAHTQANPDLKGHTLNVALQIYNDLISSQRFDANEDSFTAVIIAIKNLTKSKEQREELSKKVFDDCCKHGKLGAKFIREMNNCILKDDQLEVLGYDLSSNSLDNEWRKNLTRRDGM